MLPVSGAVFWAGSLSGRAAGARSQSIQAQALAESEAVKRLLIQQLDELFDSLSGGLGPQDDLPEYDRRLLKTWLRYDQQFLTATRNQPESRLLRATVHSRIGQSHLLLGEVADAQKQVQAAIDLLAPLTDSLEYRAAVVRELLDAHMLAVTCAERAEDDSNTLLHLKAIEFLLDRGAIEETSETRQLLQHVRERISDVRQGPAESR